MTPKTKIASAGGEAATKESRNVTEMRPGSLVETRRYSQSRPRPTRFESCRGMVPLEASDLIIRKAHVASDCRSIRASHEEPVYPIVPGRAN
jgi:hypothetical protein